MGLIEPAASGPVLSGAQSIVDPATSRAYAHGGVLVPSEHHIGVFHEWLTQRVSG